jgi:succinoglycan biosynthesis transport protein ExoP
MTDNGLSSGEGSPNRPGHRGRMREGNDGLDARDANHAHGYGKYGLAAQRPGATFYGQGGNFASGASEPAELVNYSAVLRKLWRRKFLLVSIVLLGIAGGAAIIARMPVHYVAHAFVVIGDQHAKSRLSYNANQGSGPVLLPDTGTVQTEVEVLKSPQLAMEVIRDLKLQDNPEFNPAASPAEQPAALLWVKEWFFGSHAASDPQAAAAAELSQTIDNFLGRLRVSVKENSRMVDIAFDSSNPRLAMQIANALVDRYVNNQLELRWQSAQRTSAWLQDKITQLQAKVEDAEKAVEEFRAQAGLFSAPGGTPLLLKQMTDVSAELTNAQTARLAVEARLSQLRAPGQAQGRVNPTNDIVDSPFMRTLDGHEAEAQQKLAEASASMGEKNPVTIGLRERLRHVQAAKHIEGLRVAASLENELKIARTKERDLNDRLDRLQGDVAEMNRSEIKLRALEREAQADRLVLNNVIGRFKEASQEGDISSQRPDAQIVSYAQLPVSPDRPKRGLLIVIAGMASLMGGALVALLLENADRSLHGLEEVEELLKVTGLGMLPISKAAQLSPSEAARYGSLYREAAKATYSRLFYATTAPKVTVVTSAFPEEGKTTLALSLAAMAAQGGQRVLFVDADFWKSGAGTALGIRSGAGLAELLEGKAKLADVIVSDVASGADIILPGTFSRASLLAWVGNLPKLLASLKNQYDVVIIDAPPILSVSEATLLAGHADATVVAIRWAATPREAVKIALKKLHDAGAVVAGSVLTMVRERQHAKYGYPETAYFSKNLALYRPQTRAVTRSAEPQHSNKRTGLPRLSKSSSPRPALLVLDVQEVFTCSSGRYSPSPEASDRLIETINGLSQMASKFGIMVIYAQQEREKKLDGNPAMRIRSDKRLKMVSGHSFVRSGRDAFSKVELDDVLRKYGIAHLFLVGLDGVTSIKQTARSALDLGYRVTFVQDGIFTAFERKWERLLKDFESAAAFAITSEEFAEFAIAVHQASEAQRHPDDTRDRLIAALQLLQADPSTSLPGRAFDQLFDQLRRGR